MGRLMKYLKDYKKESVLAPLFKLLEAFFELLVPLVMASIIDRGIGSPETGSDMGHIGRMGACLLVLAVVGLLSSVTAQFFAARAAVGFSTKLRQALFDHIQSLSFTNIDKVGTSTMITRMTSDINQVQSGVNMVLRLFLRSPVIVFGAMIMAFTIDVKSALIFVVAIPLLTIVVIGVMAWTMPLYKKVQAGLDKVLGITRENLTGVRVIRAFHREAAEEKEFRQHTEALARSQIFVGKISAIMNPFTYVIVNGAIIALIYTGALQVNVGNLTQGEVIAIINYMSQILVELVKLANLIVTITKALACADRVAGVFEIQNGEDAALSAGEQTGQAGVDGGEAGAGHAAEPANGGSAPFLQFDHASFGYAGAGADTLHDLNFTVNRGETIGVIGGTGSGKSSLVNLIPGFYPVTGGAIRMEGRDLKAIPEEELRGRVGVVPQKAVLFKGTIRSNLQWGKPDATEEEMWQAIETAQARDIVEGKEGRLEILILDDSASALDYATDAKLRAALKKLEGNTTTFIVSQRASTVRHADKILVLDDGELAGAGTHDELLAGCAVYREIYFSQYPEERLKAAREQEGMRRSETAESREGIPAEAEKQAGEAENSGRTGAEKQAEEAQNIGKEGAGNDR